MSIQLDNLMTKAQSTIEQDTYKGIELYQQAISEMEKLGSAQDSFDYLYAHYMLMFYYPHAGASDEVIVAYAKKCLDIVEPSLRAGVIPHFLEIGKLQKEVLQSASNAFVYHSLDKAKIDEDYQALLEQINVGCDYAKEVNEQYFNTHDTKVTVLARMNRMDEAFDLIKKLQDLKPTFHDDEGISKSEAYAEWLKTFKIVYTKKEIKFLKQAKKTFDSIAFEEVIPHDANLSQKFDPEIDEEGNIIITGNLYIDGDMDEAWYENNIDQYIKTEYYVGSVVIKGNLFVKGVVRVIQNLAIQGSVYADFIYSDFTMYNTYLLVKGSVFLKYGFDVRRSVDAIEVREQCIAPIILSLIENGEDAEINISYKIMIHAGFDKEDTLYSVDGEWYRESQACRLLKPRIWHQESDEGLNVEYLLELLKRGVSPFVELDENTKMSKDSDKIKQKIDEYNQAVRNTFEEDEYDYYKISNTVSVTDEDINELELLMEMTIPLELKDFYRQYGRLVNENNGESYCLSLFEPKALIEYNTESFAETYSDRKLSFGLIDQIILYWGFDRPEFQVYGERDEGLTKEETAYINDSYKCFGHWIDGDIIEGAYYLFFDKEGNFGEVYYHQDAFSDTALELKKLISDGLTNSRSLEDILVNALETAKNTMIEWNK